LRWRKRRIKKLRIVNELVDPIEHHFCLFDPECLLWMLTNDWSLMNWSSLLLIVGVAIGPLLFYYRKWDHEASERKRASKNLFLELNDALDGLDENKHNLKEVILQDGSKAYYMNRGLNHDFYDSLLSSGNISFLKPELQQTIQDSFQKIKDHNLYLRKIIDIADNSKPGEDLLPKYSKYFKILDIIEIDLLKEIPKIKEKLKHEFKIDPSISS